MMTERIFKSMMNKIPAGEYKVDGYGLWSLYQNICPKTYKDTSKFENQMRYYDFCRMFDEAKYGFEYRFKGRIRYVGTNDLDFLVVEK